MFRAVSVFWFANPNISSYQLAGRTTTQWRHIRDVVVIVFWIYIRDVVVIVFWICIRNVVVIVFWICIRNVVVIVFWICKLSATCRWRAPYVFTLVPSLSRNQLDYCCGNGGGNENSLQVYEILRVKFRASVSSRSREYEWPASSFRSFISGIRWTYGRWRETPTSGGNNWTHGVDIFYVISMLYCKRVYKQKLVLENSKEIKYSGGLPFCSTVTFQTPVVTIYTTYFHTKSMHSEYRAYICVSYGSHNKQPIFFYTSLTGWCI
jgi:hypothetical protein